MRDVRKSQIVVWAATLAVLVWACGGSGGSPTAPASFEEGGIEQVSGNMGPPPGKGNKGEDVDWMLSASGPFPGAPRSYSMPSASSMTFSSFNMNMDAMLGETEIADANVCFADTFWTADNLEIAADRKDPSQLEVTYKFGGYRLDGAVAGNEITYEIVFTGVSAASGDYSPAWPPQVGTVTLTGTAYQVRGVAQRNNTCNGVGSLPAGNPMTLTLCGGPCP